MSRNAKTDHTKLALQRLALDPEVQEHLGNAVVELRDAWRRAAHRPAAVAVEDRKLYARIRRAAISLAQAVKLLERPPEPPKRRGRKLAGLMLVAGGGALIIKRRRGSASKPPDSSAAAEPPVVPTAEPQPTVVTPT
jgi:ferric-dicitrate binding protein FerR (iron transport regulator)